MKIRDVWKRFIFELAEKAANEFLALVLCGKKKATSSSLYLWKGQNMPKKGDYGIVTDFCGVSFC